MTENHTCRQPANVFIRVCKAVFKEYIVLEKIVIGSRKIRKATYKDYVINTVPNNDNGF